MSYARERLTLQDVDTHEGDSREIDEVQGMFVSEWLTEHPISLAGKYPAHIWLHADSPSLSSERRNLDALNRVGIVHLREGRPDAALMAWRSMEDETRASVPKREQPPLLAVAYNNLAGVYHALHKSAPALQYIERAARLEQRAYGTVDFATRMRHGAICSRARRHAEALRHCTAALESLRAAGSPALMGTDGAGGQPSSSGGSGGGDDGTAAVARAYQSHLAVAYHNVAVQLANCQQLGHASAMVNVAAQLAARCLSPKHRWCKQISASVAKLRDLHVATTFVTHSLRPRLAMQQARAERQARMLSMSRAAVANPPHEPPAEITVLRGSSSLPAIVGRR